MNKNYNNLALVIAGLVLFLSVTTVLSEQRQIDPHIQLKIDNFIQNEYLPASGVSLAIVQNNGELLYTTGYGLANKEKEIPNGNETQFCIGSVTKSFTALLLVKLLNEKFPHLREAVLDQPIRSFLLPNFTLNDRFRSEHVTVRDILAHRVCLRRGDFYSGAFPFNSTEEVVYRLRYNEEICGIRSEFQYNNQMYAFAGELAGMLAGKAYEEAMQDLLIELGMFNSALVKWTDNLTEMPGRAMPYYVKDNQSYLYNPELVKRVIIENAAGGLCASSNDMARYLKLHLNSGSLDGKQQIIPKEVMNWVYKPNILFGRGMNFKKDNDETPLLNQIAYGFGIIISTYDDWEYRQHGGLLPPYYSLLSLYPAKNLGIFSSGNAGPELVSRFVLHAFIFETLNGNPDAAKKAWMLHEQLTSANIKSQSSEKYQSIKIVQGKTKIENILGKYGSGSSGDLQILEKWNENKNQTVLYLEYGLWACGWLEDVYGNGTIFKINFDTDIVHDFYRYGVTEPNQYLAVDGDEVTFYELVDNNFEVVSLIFKKGVSRETLPETPWKPDSCGPENI